MQRLTSASQLIAKLPNSGGGSIQYIQHIHAQSCGTRAIFNQLLLVFLVLILN